MEKSLNNRINILHVIEQLPFGGAENLLLTLARNIDKRKINLIFLCLKSEGYIAELLKNEGFNVIFFGNYRTRHFYKKIIDIIKLIYTEKIDIVHTHLRMANRYGMIIGILSKIPKICKSEHGWLLNPSYYSPIRRKIYTVLDKILDRFADRVIYVSKVQMKILSDGKNDPHKHIVIYNGFDKKRFSVNITKKSARKQYGYSDKDIVIGSLGKLEPYKGYYYLFTAVYLVSKVYQNTKILIVGNGSRKSQLEKLAETLELDILFLSKRYDVPELMKSMDIYVQPSLSETFGIAIAEAMYSGLPVVAIKVGGIPEVVRDGVTGFLVPPWDSKALSEAIISLINKPTLAKCMGEKGRDVASLKFSGERYARDMEKLYTSLIE